ncbi:TPA: Arm DNA-binding domain-containing protein [Mannheimia haemolytica]
MARVTTELNNTQIKNAKAQTKDYKLMDGKGLFLLVKKNGSKLWRFRYKKPITGKESDLGIGSYPETTLAQARTIIGAVNMSAILNLKKTVGCLLMNLK